MPGFDAHIIDRVVTKREQGTNHKNDLVGDELSQKTIVERSKGEKSRDRRRSLRSEGDELGSRLMLQKPDGREDALTRDTSDSRYFSAARIRVNNGNTNELSRSQARNLQHVKSRRGERGCAEVGGAHTALPETRI